MCFIITVRSFDIFPSVNTSEPKRRGTRMYITREICWLPSSAVLKFFMSSRAPFEPMSIAANLMIFVF